MAAAIAQDHTAGAIGALINKGMTPHLMLGRFAGNADPHHHTVNPALR